jgi:FkbM family methyltransferase
MKKTRAWVADLINKAMQPLGAMLVSYPRPAGIRRAALLKKYGISTVIDIGANEGQYAQGLRALGYRGKIVSYEPLPEAFSRLKKHCASDPDWTAHNAAVGNTCGEVIINVAGNSQSSSILPMLKLHVDVEPSSATVKSVTAVSTTIDRILATHHGENIMLKIDTQGYEYQILAQFASHLRAVALIEIELSLAPLYEGQALFREMDALLLQAGFRFVSLEEGFSDYSSGTLLQFDGIYANKGL